MIQMKNNNISEKDELIYLINQMEAMIKKDPEGFIESPDTARMIATYNTLMPLANSFGYTKKEINDINNKWESFKLHLKRYYKKKEVEKKLNNAELLLKYLEDVLNNWDHYAYALKKRMIDKINTLQNNYITIQMMTAEQKSHYLDLINSIKEKNIEDSLKKNTTKR